MEAFAKQLSDRLALQKSQTWLHISPEAQTQHRKTRETRGLDDSSAWEGVRVALGRRMPLGGGDGQSAGVQTFSFEGRPVTPSHVPLEGPRWTGPGRVARGHMERPTVQTGGEATVRCQKQEAPGDGCLSPVTSVPSPTASPATGQTPAWLQ